MAMTLVDACNNLSILVSDEQIRQDFFKYVASETPYLDDCFEFEIDSRVVRVPEDCELTTIARVAQIVYIPASMQIRVVLAVGGVLKERSGVVTPKYFFAKMLYNEECKIISIDYY